METPHSLVDALGTVRLDGVFNPYRERCRVYDRNDAPMLRKANLRAVMEAVLKAGVDSIWIARDLGFRGGRRTGLAMTDEICLPALSRRHAGIELSRATEGPTMAERTAAVIWQTLAEIHETVFLWNVFPLHPFVPGRALSNRCHTRSERFACHDFLLAVLAMLQPRRIIAIGRDAQGALAEIEITHHAVRHPSFGGQRDFTETIRSIYGLQDRPPLAPNSTP